MAVFAAQDNGKVSKNQYDLIYDAIGFNVVTSWTLDWIESIWICQQSEGLLNDNCWWSAVWLGL